MAVYIDQAGLTARVGSTPLARLASISATLDAAATSRIATSCTDANAEVDAAVSGLDLTLDPVPTHLADCAARIALATLHERTWSGAGVRLPGDLEAARKQARADLSQLKAGTTAIDRDSAQQVVARARFQDFGNTPQVDNPRTTVARRMRRLP